MGHIYCVQPLDNGIHSAYDTDMQSARAQLADWIARRGMTQREAAVLLGLHYTYLSQIILGKRSPGLANAVQIQRVTGISAESWVATEVGTAVEADPVEAVNVQHGKA